MNKKYFYERNDYLLEHDVNKTFEEVLWMNNEEFIQWCKDLRNVVVYCWDILGIPPRVGYNKEDIINQFQEMASFPVKTFICKDETTNNKDVIRNTQILGNAVNQFFPSMMKVPINYTDDADNGKSIYDFFAKDELLERFITYAKRHFKRDSFYAYSVPLQVDDKRFGLDLPLAQNPFDWIKTFNESYKNREIYSYWLAPVDDKEYTGYNEDLKGIKYLIITKQQLQNYCDEWGQGFDINKSPYMTNVDLTTDKNYQIRVFKLGQKLFPIGLKAWRVSFCQYATNFPPLTAKLLYELYTKPNKTNIVWDPSSGWGGRLLGALSVKDDREILYLGNDPNTDHNTSKGRTKYHEIYDFYCENVNRGGLFPTPHNRFKFWQLGSEEIQFDPLFQQYRGLVDMVFTSPPYFSKEAYSEDDTQSYKKFPIYNIWKEQFLYQTLITAYKWLKEGGHLLWNISDVQFGKEVLPLIQDSKDFCEKIGFRYIQTWKMSLAQMPGGNRLDSETGKPKTRYSCKVNGLWLKYEPILIFQK